MGGDKIDIGGISDSDNFTIGSQSNLTVNQTTDAPGTQMPTSVATAHTDQSGDSPQPTIGIVTALAKEYVAVKVLLENLRDYDVPGRGAGRRYLLGEVPAANGGRHAVVLSLADMGNNIAASRGTLLLEHFPQVNSIIMVGIAGGVPHPAKPDEHVRLGDIVVSNQGGVVQYDFDKEMVDGITHRHPPRPPSATLLEAVRLLEAAELEKQRPWLKFIDQALTHLEINRPSAEADVLSSSTDPSQVIAHPHDPQRIEGQPRIHIGPIASANKLLKKPLKRNRLRDQFGVKAVEMEASGIADATWNHDVGYLVVRGICDYCDANKGDDWQAYAAVIAAAYVRALLESMPGQSPAGGIAASTGYRGPTPASFQAIYRLIEARAEDENVDKAEISEIVQVIEKEAAKGQQANPNKIELWLADLADMAPDIFKVLAAYLRSPATNTTPTIRQVVEQVQAGD